MASSGRKDSDRYGARKVTRMIEPGVGLGHVSCVMSVDPKSGFVSKFPYACNSKAQPLGPQHPRPDATR